MHFSSLTSDRLSIATGEIESSRSGDAAAFLPKVTSLRKSMEFKGVARSYGRTSSFLSGSESHLASHAQTSSLAYSVLRSPRTSQLKALKSIKARKRLPLADSSSSIDVPSSPQPLVTPEKTSTKRPRESRDTHFDVGVKDSFRVTAKSLEDQKNDQTTKLVLQLVSANESGPRIAAWEALEALGSVQKFRFKRELIEFHLIAHKPESFSFQFRSLKTDVFSEIWTCELALVKDDIDVIAYNNESFLLEILKEIRVLWSPSEIKQNWHPHRAWQALKDRMSADQVSSYSSKVTELLQVLFTVSNKRTAKAWIDLETLSPAKAAGSKKADKFVLVSHEYRPFNFQIIEKHPEKLGLPKESQMITLCFWETASDAPGEKKDLLLQLNFLINKPLIEIYSLHKGPSITGSQALKFALDLREMTGASLLLFDDAKVQDATGKKAARLLLWNSISSKKMGFYESRGFRPIDIDIEAQGARHVTVYISQKAEKVVKSRALLSQASFGELSQLAKSPEHCVLKASSWLETSPQACSAMKVQQVVDALLLKMKSSDQGAVNRLIEDLHEMELLFNRGTTLAPMRLDYAAVMTTQFFLYPGSRNSELAAMPWTLSEVS